MKTTMKLAFAFLVFFGFAVGAKGQDMATFDQAPAFAGADQADYVPKGTPLYKLLTFETSDSAMFHNDSVWYYANGVLGHQRYARKLWHALLAMQVCGVDSVRWIEDPNKMGAFFGQPSAHKPIIHHTASRDAMMSELVATIERGLKYVKEYLFFASK
jgi:hypothetical protein